MPSIARPVASPAPGAFQAVWRRLWPGRPCLFGFLCAGLALPLAAVAAPPSAERLSGTATETGALTGSVPDLPGFGQKIDTDRLLTYRGGSSVLNTSENTGTVQGNSASQVITGDNTITEGSLAHSVGFPTVIQNSGANVLIQSSTIINVRLD